MDVFDLLAEGRIDELTAALAGNPALAAGRHASGASLLAFAYYVGQAHVAPAIRSHLADLGPHDAIIHGDAATVRRALAAGWDGNALAPDGFTPLGLAAFFDRMPVFELLLPITRDLNERARNPQQVAAIHAATAAGNARMVEALLRAGADPDLAQADGFTPLHAAAHSGNAAIAGLLLLFGADRRRLTARGHDAVELARSVGHGWLADRLEAFR
ncbi:MAG TPA: ankyrin repeat domain-containing protein [Alphaproteobacteria bacterium]|nr:ankyrin repeat domain-containing protein [Alphaproteobacteria bacterium]